MPVSHRCAPRGCPRHDSVHKRPNLARRGPHRPFVYTPAIPRPPTTQARSPTVYTNAQNWRREPRSSHSCTLLRSHGATCDTIVYINAPNRCPEALTAHLCTLSRLHGVARDTTVYTNAPIRRGEARSSHLCTLFGPPGPPTAQKCIQMHPRYNRKAIASPVRRLTSAVPRRTPRSCRTGWRPSRPRRRGWCAPRPERSPAPCSGCGRFPSSCWQTRPR